MEKLSGIIIRIFNVVFLVFICFIVIQASILNQEYEYNIVMPITMIIIFICITVVSFLIKRYLVFIEKKYNYILSSFLLVMLIVIATIGVKELRYSPAWDLSAVYNGAIEWVQTGNINEFKDYFYYYPNNFGALIVFKILFSVASGIKLTDYFAVATVFNSVLIVIMMNSIIGITKRLLGKQYAIIAMVVLALCFPLYFIGPVFYTDALSMVFPAVILHLYLIQRENKSIYRKVGIYTLIAVLAAIGAQIKFTVIIIIIALIIELIMQLKVRQAILLTVIMILVMFGTKEIIHRTVYPNLLDEKQAENQNIPYISWIMMGLQGNGTYDPEDQEFTRSFESTEERDKAIMLEIKNRIDGLGLRGIYELICKKTQRCFGDGTWALSDFLDDEPEQKNVLHEWITYEGEDYVNYSSLCQATFLLVMIFMIFSAISNVIHKKNPLYYRIAPRVAFFGLWIFLMMWESTGRYFSNYISIMIIIAIQGIEYYIQILSKMAEIVLSKIRLLNRRQCSDA